MEVRTYRIYKVPDPRGRRRGAETENDAAVAWAGGLAAGEDVGEASEEGAARSRLAEESRTFSSSTGHARFQVENHGPEAVDFAAFDDLKRLESIQRFVRRVEPFRDRF